DVEHYLRVVDAGEQGEHRQHDRHRAAQSDPGYVQLLAPVEAERDQYRQNGERPHHQDERRGNDQRGHGVVDELLRGDQQAKDEEHADLGHPGNAGVEAENGVHGLDLGIAEVKAGDVDREKATAVQFGYQAEDQQAPEKQQ